MIAVYMRAKENGFSEKKAKFNRNSCTDEDALGRFRKRNVTIGVVFTEHSKAASELTLIGC